MTTPRLKQKPKDVSVRRGGFDIYYVNKEESEDVKVEIMRMDVGIWTKKKLMVTD